MSFQLGKAEVLSNMFAPEHRVRRCIDLIQLHGLQVKDANALPLEQLERAVQTEMLVKLMEWAARRL